MEEKTRLPLDASPAADCSERCRNIGGKMRIKVPEIRVKKDQGRHASSGKRDETTTGRKMARVSQAPIRGLRLPSLYEDLIHLPSPACRGCVQARIRPLELVVQSKTRSEGPLRSASNRGQSAASIHLSWRVRGNLIRGGRQKSHVRLPAVRGDRLSAETRNGTSARRQEVQDIADGLKRVKPCRKDNNVVKNQQEQNSRCVGSNRRSSGLFAVRNGAPASIGGK